MRHQFGRTRSDWVMEPGEPIHVGETIGAYVPHMLPDQPVTLWTERTGGEQVTDLLDPDSLEPLGSALTADDTGNIPAFLGPDGVTWLWGSASVDGEAPRYAMTAIDVAASFEDLTGDIEALDTAVQDHGTRLNTAESDITTLQTEPTRVAGWHDVTAYGATGDGATDDTAAIQAALDQVLADGGGTVWVPGGVYALDPGPIRIYRNTTLRLAPDAVIRRASPGRMLINGDAEQDFGGYTGHGNILIEGGTWDANGPSALVNDMVMSIGHAENVTVRDTTILDVPGHHAIEFNSTRTGRAINVRCLGFIDTGSRSFSEAIQVDLAKSSSVFGGFGPYDDTVCEDILIQGCTIGPSGTPTTTSWGRGVGSHSTSPDSPHRDVRVIDCHFTDTLEWAVGAYVWADGIISGNHIHGCGAGIWVRTLDSSSSSHRTPAGEGAPTITGSQNLLGVNISGNHIVNSGGYDHTIYLEGESISARVRRAVISGNRIEGNGGTLRTGIRLVQANDVTVAGNTLIDTTGTGISQNTVSGNTVTGNRVVSPGGSGVSCDDGLRCIISGNSIQNTGSNGVHVLGGADGIVTDNTARFVDSFGVRMSTSANRWTIAGNRLQDCGDDGIGVTITCTNVKVYGNVSSDAIVVPSEDGSSNPTGNTTTAANQPAATT